MNLGSLAGKGVSEMFPRENRPPKARAGTPERPDGIGPKEGRIVCRDRVGGPFAAMAKDETTLLLLADDASIRRLLLYSLRQAGFDVEVSTTLAQARKSLARDRDLILLDLGLPDGDGAQLCRELREAGSGVPIIILTARDQPEQRVAGLDAGADDYVTKPFHLPELLARIRSVLRRSGRSVGSGPVRVGDLWADPEEHRAGRGETCLELKPREFQLLLFLLRNPGRTWTRDQLIERVWGRDFGGDVRTVDLHVRRLRSQIEEDAGDPRYIETVWGVGYRMGDADGGRADDGL